MIRQLGKEDSDEQDLKGDITLDTPEKEFCEIGEQVANVKADEEPLEPEAIGTEEGLTAADLIEIDPNFSKYVPYIKSVLDKVVDSLRLSLFPQIGKSIVTWQLKSMMKQITLTT